MISITVQHSNMRNASLIMKSASNSLQWCNQNYFHYNLLYAAILVSGATQAAAWQPTTETRIFSSWQDYAARIVCIWNHRKLGMLVDLSLSWQGHGDSTILITDGSSEPSLKGYWKLVGFILWPRRHCLERIYVNDYTKTRIDMSTNSVVIQNAITFVQQEAEQLTLYFTKVQYVRQEQ